MYVCLFFDCYLNKLLIIDLFLTDCKVIFALYLKIYRILLSNPLILLIINMKNFQLVVNYFLLYLALFSLVVTVTQIMSGESSSSYSVDKNDNGIEKFLFDPSLLYNVQDFREFSEKCNLSSDFLTNDADCGFLLQNPGPGLIFRPLREDDFKKGVILGCCNCKVLMLKNIKCLFETEFFTCFDFIDDFL